MLRECLDILEKFSLSWVLNKKNPEGDLMGQRSEGLLDTYCFMTDGLARIKIFNSNYHEDFGHGNWSIGMLIQIPVGGNDATKRTLIGKNGCYTIYTENGNIGVVVQETTSGDTYGVVTSGKNYADGVTRFVAVTRLSTSNTSRLYLKIFGQEPTWVALPLDFEIKGTEPTYILDNCVPGTKTNGVFIQTGLYLDIDSMYKYWLEYMFPLNDVVTYQLNNKKGNIVFDSGGLKQHGLIENYSDNVWVVDSTFLNWVNRWGYSDGQFALDKGVTQVEVDGIQYPIDSDMIIPVENARQMMDVLTGEVQYPQRVSLNVKIEDILCYKGNGVTYGINLLNPDLILDGEEWTFLIVADKVQSFGGTLFSIGDKMEVSISTIENKLLLVLGGVSHEVSISQGWRKVAIKLAQTTFEVIIDNVSSYSSAYTLDGSSDVFRLFTKEDETNVLNGSSLSLFHLSKGLMSPALLNDFFIDLEVPEESALAFIPMSQGDFIVDLSEGGRHITLLSYSDDVWSGRQSGIEHFWKGVKLVYNSDEGLNSPVYVPASLRGNEIPLKVYDKQITVDMKARSGVPLIDAFVNMNPEEKSVGFYSRFWDKTNNNVWTGLDPVYLLDDKPWSWNLFELNQLNIELKTKKEYKRYGFVGNRKDDKTGVPVEVYDLVTLNTGSDVVEQNINF